MAAIFAASRGHRVIVVETTRDGGRKIIISGGGRCNVLPRALEPDRFVSDSPRALVRRLLRSWPLDAQLTWFERDLGIPLKFEADSGKYFPVSDRARDVRDRLIAKADRAGAQFRYETRLTDVARRADGGWSIQTTTGPIDADAIIIATGGRSVPATGSDGAGFDLAARLGHTVHPTYPALAPLVCDPPRHGALAGISLNVRIRAKSGNKTIESHGGFLFTHHGYSGPAVLDVSHVGRTHGRGRASTVENSGRKETPVSAAKETLVSAAPEFSTLEARPHIRVRWSEFDAAAWTQKLSDAGGLVLTTVARELPTRLAEQLLIESQVPLDRRASSLTRAERLALIDRLTSYELRWTGDEGYKKAEVTGGGVALDEIDPRTLESRIAPGIFFCGEILDAFGPIGGHNFAWAWATGRAAGLGS